MTGTTFVLDASIALAWCFEDEASDYAESVLSRLQSERAFVPPIWPLEIGNVLLVAERRKRIRRSESARFLNLVSRLPITVEQDAPDRSLKEVIDLGRDLGLSTYDASYLDLAMRMGIPLASLDEKLSEAARECGTPLLGLSNGRRLPE